MLRELARPPGGIFLDLGYPSWSLSLTVIRLTLVQWPVTTFYYSSDLSTILGRNGWNTKREQWIFMLWGTQ